MYYKAVKVTSEGKRISVFIQNPDFVVEYKLGVPTKPRCQHEDYGLFVSTNLGVASDIFFLLELKEDGTLRYTNLTGETGTIEIYECDIVLPEKPMKPRLLFEGCGVMQPEHDEYFYCGNSTFVVSECTLKRKVPYEELKKVYKETNE